MADSLSKRACFFLCILGLSLSLVLWRDALFSPKHVHDFTGFFIGARLLGTPHLYDIQANLSQQKALTGTIAPSIIFVRPPFYAFAFKPLALLSYPVALALWKIFILAALVAFVWMFPLTPRKWTALAVCWSFPASFGLTMGNAVTVILLLITAALICWRQGYEYLAGMALGLCLGKFHFLVFLPFLLLQRRYRKVLCGFTVTAAALIAVNFIVQPDWIRLYWKCLNLPQENMNGAAALMPNFYASFLWTKHPIFAIAGGAILIASVLWYLCHHLSFEIAMPVCILGGLLAAPHTNQLDPLLATPAFLVIAYRYPALRVLCCALMSPITFFLYSAYPAGLGPLLFVLGCVLLMIRLGRMAIDFSGAHQRASRLLIASF